MIYGSASYMQEIIPRNKNKFKIKEGFFFQEFIEGEEYGMDILNSTDGNYVHSFTKKKLMIKNGETYSAVSLISLAASCGQVGSPTFCITSQSGRSSPIYRI